MHLHVERIRFNLNEYLGQRRIFEMSRLEELELFTEPFEKFSALVDVDARLIRVDYDKGRMRFSLKAGFIDSEWPALKIRKVSFITFDGRKIAMFTQEMVWEFLAGV